MSTPRQRLLDLLRRDILELDASLDAALAQAMWARDPAAGGLRLYRDSGFAPDFMLWLKHGEAQALGLVDPKGLARDWPQDKLDMIADLEAASLSLPVRGALVTARLPEHMALPPGMQATAESLWTTRVLRQSDAEHIDHLMNHLRAALCAPETA